MPLLNPFLVGPRVYLRAFDPADATVVTPWFNDPAVTRFLLVYRPINARDEAAWLAQAAQAVHAPHADDMVLAIALRDGDRLVGSIGLHDFDWRNRHASLGIVLGDPASWGHGYGPEAMGLLLGHGFEVMNLNRVWLHVYEYNDRALRVYHKAGFRTEGRLRQHTFRDGRYWDVLTMGLLRDEWAAARGARTDPVTSLPAPG